MIGPVQFRIGGKENCLMFNVNTHIMAIKTVMIEQIKAALGTLPEIKAVNEVMDIPEYDSTNRQGLPAYSLLDELQLLSLLNTQKLQPQYYRTEGETIQELKELIWKLAQKEPYFVAQCIVWSRCCGEGMRSINNLAAAILATFISHYDWAKRFYGPFNKQSKNSGGCIYRLDDMSEIKNIFSALNKSTLTNAMKKGFASVLEKASAYELAKYKKTTINISNLAHPNSKKAIAGDVLNDIMQGKPVSADTWEVNNSEAGQVVAAAVKRGEITESKAEVILKESKNDNWERLLNEDKLGILAAVRNLRNILKGERESVIDKVSELVKDGDKIRNGKIMPYQLEQAMTVVKDFGGKSSRKLLTSLEEGMVTALPNLKELLTGKNLVMVDCSGSMGCHVRYSINKKMTSSSSCKDKAGIIAAMIAKAVDADILVFGSEAQMVEYNPNSSLSDISEQIKKYNLGGTNLAGAFMLLTQQSKAYDRIFILSDYECNGGCVGKAYKSYITNVCSPYIYCVDMASYGSMPIKNKGKVNYYYGYGYSMFEDIAHVEFNPSAHIDKVRQIVI